MEEKKYKVSLGDYSKVLSQQEYEQKKEGLSRDFPDAKVEEIEEQPSMDSAQDTTQTLVQPKQENQPMYRVSLGDYSKDLTKDEYEQKKDGLKSQFPDAKVQEIGGADYDLEGRNKYTRAFFNQDGNEYYYTIKPSEYNKWKEQNPNVAVTRTDEVVDEDGAITKNLEELQKAAQKEYDERMEKAEYAYAHPEEDETSVYRITDAEGNSMDVSAKEYFANQDMYGPKDGLKVQRIFKATGKDIPIDILSTNDRRKAEVMGYDEKTKEYNAIINQIRAERAKKESASGFLGQQAALAKNAQDVNELNYGLATRLLDDAKTIMTAPVREEGLKKVGKKVSKGIGDTLSDTNFWTFGLADTADSLAVRRVFEKLARKTDGKELLSEEKIEQNLSPSEKAVALAYVDKILAQEERKDDTARAYDIAKGTFENLGFIAQIILTGGVGKPVSEAATRTMANWLTKGLGKKATQMVGKNVIKYGSEIAGNLARAGVVTPLMPMNYANIADKSLEFNDDGSLPSMSSAVLKGTADTYIENLSELAGEHIIKAVGLPIKGLGKVLDKGAKLDALKSMPFAEWAKAIHRWPKPKILKEAAWDGFLGEYVEEWFGAALRDVTRLDPEALEDFRTIDNQILTAGVLAPMSIFGFGVSAANFGIVGHNLHNAKKDLKALLKRNNYSDEQIDYTINEFNEADPKKIADTLAPIVNQVAKDVSAEEAKGIEKAAMVYANKAAEYQTYWKLKELDTEDKKAEVRDSIEAEVGGKFWQDAETKTNGLGEKEEIPERVEVLNFADGSVGYVTSVSDGQYAISKNDGTKVFMTEDDINKGKEDQTILSTEQTTLNGYLNAQVLSLNEQQKENNRVREQEEMDAERLEMTQQLAQPGQEVALGSAENPMKGVITQQTPNGIIVNMADGSYQELNWDQTSNLFGIPRQTAQADTSEDFVTEEEVAANDTTPATTETISETETVAEGEEPAVSEMETTAVAPDAELTAEQEDELWNQSPSEWARWNDQKRADGGKHTQAYVGGKIASLDKDIAALEEQAIKAENRVVARDIESQLAQKQARRAELQSIIDSYAQAENVAETAQESAVEETPVATEEMQKQNAESAMKAAFYRRAKEWSDKVGMPVRMVESKDEEGLPKSAVEGIIEAEKKGAVVTGWYDATTGEVMFYLPHMTDLKDIDSTYVHEIVAHKGLRALLGKEKFGEFCDNVWENLMEEKDKLLFLQYAGVGTDVNKAIDKAWDKLTQEHKDIILTRTKGNESFAKSAVWLSLSVQDRMDMLMSTGDATTIRRNCADEFVARLSESAPVEERKTVWESIVSWIHNALRKIGIDISLNETELSATLKESFQNLVSTPVSESVANTESKDESKLNQEQTDSEAFNDNTEGTDGGIRFSQKQNPRIIKDTKTYYSKHFLHTKKMTNGDYNRQPMSTDHLPLEVLDNGIDQINAMSDFLEPYMDMEKDGKRLLPAEVYGKGLSTIFSDDSYGKTMENTLICTRTLAYLDFVNEVKETLGRPIEVLESFLCSQKIYDIAKDPQCLYCYVSLDRKSYDAYLLRYLEQRDAAIEKLRKNPENAEEIYAEFLGKRKDTKNMRNRFASWEIIAKENNEVGAADLATEERRSEFNLIPVSAEWKAINAKLKKIKGKEERAKFRESDEFLSAKARYLATPKGQVADATAYAQSASWAKALADYRSYNGELLKMSTDTAQGLMEQYGLRFYSFSEYSPAFILENMQMVLDASVRGFKGFAYTKEVDFIKIFAPTGMNINCSVFGRPVYNEKKELVDVRMDTKQGADWNEVKKLREQYGNVGAVFVATSNEMIEWALNQDWIDVIIPFHMVKTGQIAAELYGWTNYTGQSGDRGEGGTVEYIKPIEHKNDKELFLKICEERGLAPRFSQHKLSNGKSFATHPNYMRLVNETRRNVDETPVLTPNYNLEEAKDSFNRFVEKGGYYGGYFISDEAFREGVEQVVEDIRNGVHPKNSGYGPEELNEVIEKAEEGRVTTTRVHKKDVRNINAVAPKTKIIIEGEDTHFRSVDITPEVQAEMDSIVATSIVNGTYMKAPNGKPTNLSREQWAIVRTSAFKDWFGDWQNKPEEASKIVDENGEPMVVYHGTPAAGFNEFRTGKFGGIWFTTSRRDADSYGANVEQKLYDPSETKESKEANVGDYRIGNHMTFDTKEDMESFLAEHPDAEQYATPAELNAMRDEIDYGAEGYEKEEARIDELEEISKRINRAYRKYDNSHLYETTFGDILDNYESYTLSDMKRALFTYDSNADTDFLNEYKTEAEKKDALAESLDAINKESMEESGEDFRDAKVRARAKRSAMQILSKSISNRTYATFVNLRNPLILDSKGKSMASAKRYADWKKIAEDSEYDGAFFKNTTVGAYQNAGDVVIAKDGSQVKSATDNTGEFSKETRDIRFRTSSEIEEQYPNWLAQTTESGRHSTQIAGTKSTYEKIGNWFKDYAEKNGIKDPMVLDASSGLGYGTEAIKGMGINIEDVEPYPSKDRKAPTYKSYGDIDKKYDLVISNAVLNVIPDDWRDDVLHMMSERVKDGGKMIINVRSADEIKNIKNKEELDSPSEVLVKRDNGSIRSYQKGFGKKELEDYVKSILGMGWSVESANKKNSGLSGARAVVATKMPVAQAMEEAFPDHRKGESMVKSDADFVEGEIMFRMTKNTDATIRNWAKKAGRDDFQSSVLSGSIDGFFPDDTTKQLCAAKWFLNGTIELPEDNYKVEDAVDSAKRHKVDPLKFHSPMEIIDTFGKVEKKVKPINPNKVSTLKNKRELSNGIAIYDVDNSAESMRNMREIINTHWGKDANPWCLLVGEDGVLKEEAVNYWNYYNAYPKQVAFVNGRLNSFSANKTPEKVWWSRMDVPYNGIPIRRKLEGDPMNRVATIEFSEKNGENTEKIMSIEYGEKGKGIYAKWKSLDELPTYAENIDADVTILNGNLYLGRVGSIQLSDQSTLEAYDSQDRALNAIWRKDGKLYKIGHEQDYKIYEVVFTINGVPQKAVVYSTSGDVIKSTSNFNEIKDIISEDKTLSEFIQKYKEVSHDGFRKYYGDLLRKDSLLQFFPSFQETPDGGPDGGIKPMSELSNEQKEGNVMFRTVGGSLVGMHNISEDKLRKAMKKGGLANPSTAVVDIDEQDFNSYGSISLVMPSSLVDAKAGRNVGTYTADAWTPTYPRIEMRLTDDKVKQFKERINQSVEDEGLRKDLLRYFEGFLQNGDSVLLHYVFLKEKGVTPEIVRENPNYNMDDLEKLLGYKPTGSYEEYKEKFEKLPYDAKMEFKKRYVAKGEKMSLQDEVAPIGEDTYGKVIWDVKESDKKNGVDTFGTMMKASNQVAKERLSNEYLNWVDELVESLNPEEVFFDGYTPSGRRRYIKNTLDNVSKWMKKQGRNAATGSAGFSRFIATLATPKKTLSSISKASGRLSEDADTKAFREKWGDVYYTLANAIAAGGEYDYDSGEWRMEEIAKVSNPSSYLKSRYGIEVDEQWLKDFNAMRDAINKHFPARYFETKFERPVYLNEFAGAVIPEGTSLEVVGALMRAGLPIYEYNPDVEGSRREATLKATDSEDIRFRVSNNNQAIFVSNAAYAVENISMNKATPEQWLKMIQKNGGLKAGEDKWMGLSDFLKSSDKKTLTKDEVLDFINENMIRIEEQGYVEGVNEYDILADRFGEEIRDAYVFDDGDFKPDVDVKNIASAIKVYNKFNDTPIDESTADDISDDDYQKLRDYGEEILAYLPILEYQKGIKPINMVRLDYTTEDLDNKREIALVVPTIEPWNVGDEIHFGDAGDGRAIAWARFGETSYKYDTKPDEILEEYLKELGESTGMEVGTDEFYDALTPDQEETLTSLQRAAIKTDETPDARVLVIDEIQSKRHQEGRERGYLKEGEVETVTIEIKESEDGKGWNRYEDGEVTSYVSKMIAPTYQDALSWLNSEDSNVRQDDLYGKVPDAPFEKNWAELAMKRMLRYAAENGYKKLAWTSGATQANRYSLSSVLESIEPISESDKAKTFWLRTTNRNENVTRVDKETGVIIKSQIAGAEGKPFSELVGKALAEKAMATKVNSKIEGKGLKIGGEGMKAFYDFMLPNFMNKYVRKWGTKVEDIYLPNISQTVHSVDITPEMRDSVMEGQLMFRFIGKEGAKSLDKAEEATIRMDNLNVAREMLGAKKSAKEIKMATGWEKGVDGKWRYETEDIEWKKTIVGGLRGTHKLGGIIKDNELFKAYPKLRDTMVKFEWLEGGESGHYDSSTNTIVVANNFLLNVTSAIGEIEYMGESNGNKTFIIHFDNDKTKGKDLSAEIEVDKDGYIINTKSAPLEISALKYLPVGKAFGEDVGKDMMKMDNDGEKISVNNERYKIPIVKRNEVILSILSHEIQHAIQGYEGFAKGGNDKMVDTRNIGRVIYNQWVDVKSERDNTKERLENLEKKMLRTASYMRDLEDAIQDNKPESLKSLNNKYEDMGYSAVKNFDEARELLDNTMQWYRNALSDRRNLSGDLQRLTYLSNSLYKQWYKGPELGYKNYKRLAGEVESRNVQKRRYMTPEERRKSLISDTQEIAPEDQIFIVDSIMENYNALQDILEKDGENVMFRRVEGEADTIARLKDITGAIGHKDNSAYAEGKTEDGENWVIRIANHPANMSNFVEKNPDADYILSIVVNDDFDAKREKQFGKEPITNEENVWQVVIPTEGINWDFLETQIQHFKDWGDGSLVGAVSDVKEDVMFRTIEPATQTEMDDIKAKAIADGTYLKAPNGEDTNLTEEQWMMVRTSNFINWFGDWINDPENASKVVDENGEPRVVYHGTQNKSFTIFDNSRDSQGLQQMYFTKDLGVASHFSGEKAVYRFEDVAEQIPLIKTEEELLKFMQNNMNVKSMKIEHREEEDNKDWGIHIPEHYAMVIEYKDGETAYPHLKSRVVWTEDFKQLGGEDAKNYKEALRYAIEMTEDQYRFLNVNAGYGRNLPVFLNLRNPIEIDAQKHSFYKLPYEGKTVMTDVIARDALEKGNDGVIIENVKETDYENYLTTDYITQNPNQVKSAFDNNGDFSRENDDILFRTLPATESASVNEMAERLGVDVADMYTSLPFGAKATMVGDELHVDVNNTISPKDAVYSALKAIVNERKLSIIPDDKVMSAVLATEEGKKAVEDLKKSAKGNPIQIAKEFNDALMNVVSKAIERPTRTEEDNNLLDSIQDIINTAINKVGGTDITLNRNESDWLMWQNINRGHSILDEAKRVTMSVRLTPDDATLDALEKGHDVRFRTVYNDASAESAVELYNGATSYWWNRIHEGYIDQYDSVNALVDAIEKATGKKAQNFEDVRLALNQQSSKGLAMMNKYERDYLNPLWDVVREFEEEGVDMDNLVRYMQLKHGLERNIVFAKRDAVRKYKEEYRKEVKGIRKNDQLSDAEKEAMIKALDEELEINLANVEAGKDSVYKEMRKDYSGLKDMTNTKTYISAEKEAKAEVEEFEGKYKDLCDRLWDKTKSATNRILKMQYDANMLSKDQYNHLMGMFDNYIPLRGFDGPVLEDFYSYYATGSTGYSKPVLGAKGRKSRSASPFGFIASMASSAIASNMKNETKLALYYFISNRPDNGLVTISDTWYEKGIDADGNEAWIPVYPSFGRGLSGDEMDERMKQWEEQMEEKREAGLARKGSDRLKTEDAVVFYDPRKVPEHILNVRVLGKNYSLIINGDPRAAQAINGLLNVERDKDYENVFGKVLRWLSAVNTSYNPEFWITNFMRDTLFSFMAVSAKEDAAYNRKFAANYARALKVVSFIRKNRKGELGDKEIERYYEEFLENGGVTGYTVLKDNEEWEKELQKYNKAKDREKVAVMNMVGKAFQGIQDLGEGIEQVSRFAAYLTSRQMGKDIRSAVNDAKEITVNFNRKGSGKMVTFAEAKRLTDKNGKQIGFGKQCCAVAFSLLSAYARRAIMFFNAATQGLNNFLKLVKRNPAVMSAWIGGYIMMGAINAILHALTDDDDDYLDMPDYERRTALLLGKDGIYFKWQLPQEARAFYGIGDMIVNHAMGRTPHKNIVKEASQMMLDILPVNATEGLKALLPAYVVPIYEIAVNRDYKGSKIYNDMPWLSDEEKKRTPEYTKAWKSSNQALVDAFGLLNKVGGGDETDPGVFGNTILMNPAAWEHVMESVGGGALRTANKLFKTILGPLMDQEFSVRNTPFISKMFTINDERSRNTYINELNDYFVAEAEHTKNRLKKYKENGDDEGYDKLAQSIDYEMMVIYEKGYKKVLQKLKDYQKLEEDRESKKELQEEIESIKKEMNKELSELIK